MSNLKRYAEILENGDIEKLSYKIYSEFRENLEKQVKAHLMRPMSEQASINYHSLDGIPFSPIAPYEISFDGKDLNVRNLPYE